MSLKLAKVPVAYRCPFCNCPDHSGDFWESKVFGRPICGPCRMEISIFIEEPERREDPVVVAVEQFTGRPWSEVRIPLLQEELEDWIALAHEDPAPVNAGRQIEVLRQLLQDAGRTSSGGDDV